MSDLITVGLDLGDKYHSYCMLAAEGQVLSRGRIANRSRALEREFSDREPMLVALECGTHSPWVSRKLEQLGHRVLVANARELRLIYGGRNKSDAVDAEKLARLARFDPNLLSPIRHRSARAQADLAILRSRDALVRSRTMLINHVRGLVKSAGCRLPSCSAQSFHRRVCSHVPAELCGSVAPVLTMIESLTLRIKVYDVKVEQCCQERYPETERLRQISGVGPLTALAFVLTLEDPGRFRRSRSVPAYLGLVPRRAQSGALEKQLRISKAGDAYLRRLLVSCAHYILGRYGRDSALRLWGLSLAERGGGNGRKRAVVALARKLAVVLHRLWLSGESYEPFPRAEAVAA
jgi:transposase